MVCQSVTGGHAPWELVLEYVLVAFLLRGDEGKGNLCCCGQDGHIFRIEIQFGVLYVVSNSDPGWEWGVKAHLDA